MRTLGRPDALTWIVTGEHARHDQAIEPCRLAGTAHRSSGHRLYRSLRKAAALAP
jgi:hypothetical protein